MTELGVAVGDVVQMDPRKCRWGAVLVVVDQVAAWGIRGYFLAPGAGGAGGPVIIQGTNAAYLRAAHGEFVRVGKAAWMLRSPDEEQAP